MNDEIKEILDDLKHYSYCYDNYDKKKHEINRLLDYITNLQQENDKLKKLEYKFFYCSEDEESFTLEDYLELGNKVYDLEQENEKLKRRLTTKKLLKKYKVQTPENFEIRKIFELQRRIEKAVEKLKKIQQNAIKYGAKHDVIICQELIDILNGRSDE